ncbi:hypothetical protein [Sediminibacillus massiliensis]|uniref:hypothetical protein n=1 Tax=Sediminibacillus massiliensis TaxID=1926277 RepID=UPI0015C30A1B|nr:hypothetical protein [Sediminibacillus massiliensis]
MIDRIDEKLGNIVNAVRLARIKPVIAACTFRENANLLGAVYGFMKESGKEVLEVKN